MHTHIPIFIGVLVFLTGKREIEYMCRKVNKALNGKKRASMSVKGADTETTGILYICINVYIYIHVYIYIYIYIYIYVYVYI
jgi:HrpA-like RNA helicase